MSLTIRAGFTAFTLACAALTATAADEKKDPAPVSGTYTGNGKPANLVYASTEKSDFKEGSIVIIFTEKDHSKAKNPRIKAGFGDFGSALIVTVTPEGQVVGCEVAHSALKRSGFSDIGRIKTTDFKIAYGKVTGTLTTGGELETFGEKWEVKLKFEVKKP